MGVAICLHCYNTFFSVN
uniref:Uncharacterized protein n=1 Tax=Anguilla anguilla TaxID=7936 RepID=A0A0E9VXI1_ANGAN